MGEIIDFNAFKQSRIDGKGSGQAPEPKSESAAAPIPERTPVFINTEDNEFLVDQAREMKSRNYTVGEIKSSIARLLSSALASKEIGHGLIYQLRQVHNELKSGGLMRHDVTKNRSLYNQDNRLTNMELPELFDLLLTPSSAQRSSKPAYYGLIAEIIESKISQKYDPGDELIDSIYEQV